MEFFNYKNIEKPLKGDLLISEPFLPDPNFERTVILLCEHNEEGSFGFVLNKLSVLRLNEVIEGVDDIDAPLFVGGPVQQNTLHFIHSAEQLAGSDVEIMENVFWGGNFEQLLTLLSTNQISANEVRFFLGYSGWSTEQLETEIRDNSWIVARGVHSSRLFDTDAEKLWKELLTNMGGRFKVYANYPPDPNLN